MDYEFFRECVRSFVVNTTGKQVDDKDFDEWLKPYHANLAVSRLNEVVIAQEYLKRLKSQEA